MLFMGFEGIAVVAAAGNYNLDACAYSPASSPHVLTVSVLTSSVAYM